MPRGNGVRNESGTLSDLLNALSTPVRTEASGVLFLRVDGNHAAQVCFQTGSIVGLRFGPCRGKRALELFKLAGHLSWRFDDTVLANHHLADPELADTATILEELRRCAPPAAPPATIDLEAARAALMPDLIRHLGPIAELLFDSALDQCGEVRHAQDWDRLISLLAAEIGVSAEVAEFKANARRIVASPPAT